MVTREDVKQSMEYRWRGGQWKLYLALWAVISVASPVIGLLSGSDPEALPMSVGILAVMYFALLMPFGAYALWRQWEILRRCERYQRYQVKLCNPVTSWLYKGAVYYRVAFRTEDGQTVVRDTKPMFSSRALATFQLEDYNNKTVDIFYDPEKDRVILAG